MVQIVLLAGKILFLVVLYVFVLMVVRSTTKDLKVLQRAQAPESYGVAAHPAAPAPVPAPAAAVAASPVRPSVSVAHGWVLVAEAGPDLSRGEAYDVPLGAFVVVGRAPDAHVRLRDTFVSSHHARFTAEAGGLRVEDLGSTNGTFVEGRELEPETSVLLGAGGRVSVGDTVFVVEAR
jgi:hypothetical protein